MHVSIFVLYVSWKRKKNLGAFKCARGLGRSKQKDDFASQYFDKLVAPPGSIQRAWPTYKSMSKLNVAIAWQTSQTFDICLLFHALS